MTEENTTIIIRFDQNNNPMELKAQSCKYKMTIEFDRFREKIKVTESEGFETIYEYNKLKEILKDLLINAKYV